MFNINLYTLNKRDNSTKRPSGSGTVLSCLIKSQSSIITPVVEVNVNPIAYNYAYISAFNRYYFITDIIYDSGLWSIYLKCDVLATYKDTIGSTNLYILRSSANSDGNIIDTLYPAKSNSTRYSDEFTKPFPTTSGSYVAGYVNGSPLGITGQQVGSLAFSSFTPTGFTNLVAYLLDTDNMVNLGTGFSEEDGSLELQKSLIDPISYIRVARWVPYDVSPGAGAFVINGWVIPGINYTGIARDGIITNTVTVNIRKHPKASTRGNYLNGGNFSKYWLDVQPYGVIDLDNTLLMSVSSITLTETLDVISGEGILQIYAGGVCMNTIVTERCVEVQLSQISRDKSGSLLRAGLSGAVSGIANNEGFTGLLPSLIRKNEAKIQTAISDWVPKSVSSTGNSGGFATVRRPWSINCQFFDPVDDDNAHNGRPLCIMATPSSLGGYMLVQDGDVSISGTSAEDQEVRNYLESGFYYE